ncbi:hypothetical protein LAZ67_10000372 [Cordylochernes scorpioides]|uniref:tRNA(Ile)-lysidine/2-thiocytidine synthase N-terminal domain-containing protein n=1 Tax=Cordylochernes scorpioides TaxID=51811 RepID=A0ABY6L001_9ARAC|nr:hypothetical protein LAZ67_10000372 [Cordylochernes scorpioides]
MAPDSCQSPTPPMSASNQTGFWHICSPEYISPCCPTLTSATDIIGQASAIPGSVKSICSFCSRMKRGIIYACARNNGYNVIALGQHLDDLAER